MARVVKENERYVMQRAEDRSFFAAFDYYTTRYKVIIWALVALALAMGFDYKTPKATFQELQGQITENKKQVDSVVLPKVSATQDQLSILLKLRCADTTVDRRTSILTGLDAYCSSSMPDWRK